MSVWQAKVATLFPEMFPGVLGQSLAGKALENGIWSLDVKDIRDHATDRHRTVDDNPFGGGAGMVMRPDIVDAALRELRGSAPQLPLGFWMNTRPRKSASVITSSWAANCRPWS